MKRLIKIISTLFIATLVRIFIQPIILILPIKNRIIFIGFSKSYIGNCRYMFEYMRNDYESYFLTNSFEIYEKYNENADFIYYKSFKAKWFLMTSKVIVMDSTTPSLMNLLIFRAKKVQLWHGNGMKRIGILQMVNNKLLLTFRLLVSFYSRTVLKYDIVYFTSTYAYENRKESFRFKDYKLNGQPRNDILLNTAKDITKATNRFEKFSKIILYAPTWRERKDNVNSFKLIDFNALNSFCCEHNFLFLVKFHPEEKHDIKEGQYSNIKILPKRIDLYETLAHTDVLITDYSSIYFDYLLLNRPIIFFPFDKIDYLTNQHNIVYNYDEITPGKQTFTVYEVINELEKLLLKKNDSYASYRDKIIKQFYAFEDNKSRERAKNDIIALSKINRK